MKVLVTCHVGFIGSVLTLRLLERGDEIVGVLVMLYPLEQRLAKERLCVETPR